MEELIGRTPLLEVTAETGRVLAKLEGFNPYSVEGRIARSIIDAAEGSRELPPNGTIVEATSGNTGIGLAAVAAARGLDCILTMPASMSMERRAMLQALGADLEITRADGGMTLAKDRAGEIAATGDETILAPQFRNRTNPRAHRETTDPEIWNGTDGKVDAVVAGVGTGGTITGVTEHWIEARGEPVTMIAVEPERSPTVTEQSDASYGIQGIGPGFLPDILRTELVAEVHSGSDADAKWAARTFARTEGVLVRSPRVRRSWPQRHTPQLTRPRPSW